MAVSTIKTNGWRKVDTVTGSNTIAIPNNTNELLVEVQYNDANFYFSFYLAFNQLSDAEKSYTQGDNFGSTSYGAAQINAKKSYVYLNALYISGTNHTSTSKMTLFVR